MIKSCYIDGRAFERDDFPNGVYVYQTIMTFGHQALHLAAYMQLLDKASQEILHRPSPLKTDELSSLISNFLRKYNYPTAMPAHVEVRLYHSGEVVLLGGEVSPYPQIGMRLVMPAGVDVIYDLPFSEQRSSLRRTAAEVATLTAESRGAKVAVRFDTTGCARSVDDAEIFVVEGYIITTSATPTSVEGQLLAKAIIRAGLQLEIRDITPSLLDNADEIFYADHRGITALGSYNQRPMMHILAEKIAQHFQTK